jgi:membrane fusion protein, multidrug efflux system
LTAQNIKPVEDLGQRPDIRTPKTLGWRHEAMVMLKILLSVSILAVAAVVSLKLYYSAPVAERMAPPRVPRLVEVIEVMPATQGPRIEAWGEVVAARTLVVRPEEGGTIVELSERLTPGGLVSSGEVMIRLDDREQRLALAQAAAEIKKIEARITIEDGQQERAKRDLERLPGKLTEAQRQLILRAPQKAELEAELAVATAERDNALVALSQTVIRSPFDALVIDEQLALGTMLNAGSASATLVAADRFYVVVAVPVSALDWINPKSGQIIRLTQPGVWPEDAFREGTAERLTGGLSTAGRMAEVVISVDDPLARKPENLGKPRLMLGSFLQAVGEGRVIEAAVALDRAYLHEDDTVWLMTPDNRLEMRTVTVAWRGAEQVLISDGLAAGDRVITTPLAVVAPGMKVRVAEDAGAEAGG